jgi:hypothetical protein
MIITKEKFTAMVEKMLEIWHKKDLTSEDELHIKNVQYVMLNYKLK